METLQVATEELLGEIDWLRVVRAVIVIALVLVGAKIAQTLLGGFTARLIKPREGTRDYALRLRRAQTLLPLVLEIERYVIYFLVVATVLAQFGIDTGAILASVGVVGIAVGFGAQNLVKDVISGFFLLFDGLLAVGDVVKVNADTSGVVEAVGLRNTQLRDFSGLLWIVPNGDLRQFGNFNRDWMRAVVPVDIAKESDVAAARDTMLEVGRRWAEENQEIVLEPPEVHGLMALGETSMRLRLVIKVKAMTQWAAERELLARVKTAFDERGIVIPYPRRVIVSQGGNDAAA